MNLREFLAWWLRGLRATAVNLDEFVTQRRHFAALDAEWEREAAEYEARIAGVRERLNRLCPPQPLSPEALWERPAVEPDLRRHALVQVANDLAVVEWLRMEYPQAWWYADYEEVRDVADRLLVLREAQIAGMVEL